MVAIKTSGRSDPKTGPPRKRWTWCRPLNPKPRQGQCASSESSDRSPIPQQGTGRPSNGFLNPDRCGRLQVGSNATSTANRFSIPTDMLRRLTLVCTGVASPQPLRAWAEWIWVPPLPRRREVRVLSLHTAPAGLLQGRADSGRNNAEVKPRRSSSPKTSLGAAPPVWS